MLKRVRADIVSPRAHFNHAGMSLPAAPVLARVHEHLDLEAEVGGYEAELLVEEELAALLASLAQLLGVAPDEVAVTESATAASEMLLWAVAQTFGYSARDRVLVDGFAYATAYATLHRLQLAGGAEVVVVPSRPDGTVDPEGLERAVDGRVRLALITHMPTHVGAVADAAAVGDILAGTDALYALDVSQTVGQLSLDLAAIGCDLAFAPGRKFLRGPRGTGVAYVRRSLADQLVPLTPGFGALERANPERYELAPGARRFDQFEHGVAGRLGLGVAARYASDIGLERIARLVAERSRAVTELVEGCDSLTLTGGRDCRGIVSFVHASMDADEVRARLSAQGVNAWVNRRAGAPLDIGTSSRLPSVRLSPHYVTDDGDLARLHGALRSLP